MCVCCAEKVLRETSYSASREDSDLNEGHGQPWKETSQPIAILISNCGEQAIQ